MPNGVFTLNLDETFPRLAKPPIVEAVIRWQAQPGKQLNIETFREELAHHFSDSPKFTQVKSLELKAKIAPSGVTSTEHNQRLLGFRIESKDTGEVMRFLQDSVAYSLVKSYEHWKPFHEGALETWQKYVEIASPREIQRLGVRFINHFPTATPETTASWLREPPTCPANLPLKEFVYQSTFAVPGHPFDVRVIKVMQPSKPESPQTSGLFLDIDVYSTKTMANETAAINEALRQMRWLKNKVFFSLLQQTAIDALI